jgi:hypothetical protein
VPNLRIKRERDAFRDDNACANPAVAGNRLLPAGTGMDGIPDESYDYVRKLWLDGKNAE